MKTILFFDRCDLTRLYIHLTNQLCSNFNVIHVAFSDYEAGLLKEAGIAVSYHYQNILSNFINTSVIDERLLDEIDNCLIDMSEGRFNLNGSIQSDRGFSILSYKESLLLSQSHYLVWKSIFDEVKVDLVYHEICSQFMVHIGAILCKKQGGVYRDFIQSYSDLEGYHYLNIDGENFECVELNQRYNHYIEKPSEIDQERVTSFLTSFRNNYSVFFGSEINNNISKVKIWIQYFKKEIRWILNRDKFDKLKNNIDYYLLQENQSANRLENIRQYKRLNIQFETTMPFGEKYYYYSIHLEPEATVLYLGDGIYTNQVKLIENIAASLPPDTYLYVKDHPHEYAYRKADDYLRLLKVPNIRLIHQSIPGKQIILGAIGVFSINGTAGFEALLLGKQVFCFGKCYYSFHSRVNYVRDIRSLREVVYSKKEIIYKDDVTLYAFVNALLESSHNGYVSYFGDRADKLEIDHLSNAKSITNEIIKEFYV